MGLLLLSFANSVSLLHLGFSQSDPNGKVEVTVASFLMKCYIF